MRRFLALQLIQSLANLLLHCGRAQRAPRNSLVPKLWLHKQHVIPAQAGLRAELCPTGRRHLQGIRKVLNDPEAVINLAMVVDNKLEFRGTVTSPEKATRITFQADGLTSDELENWTYVLRYPMTAQLRIQRTKYFGDVFRSVGR